MNDQNAVSTFARLKDLATETSSEKRRELLRSVTDMFLGDPCDRSETECMLFDDVISAVVKDMESAVRAELSDKLADTGAPITNTLKRFAMDDDIEVARPILERSKALTEDDLVEVIANKTQEHMLAVTRRETVSERVSGAIVDRGTDAVVASLLENSGAIIDRESMEKVTDRAVKSATIQKSFVNRDEVPLDLLNELVTVVQKDLRSEILKRFENVSEQELEAALAKSRRVVKQSFGKTSRERKAAVEEVNRMEQRGPLKLEYLLKYLQENSPHAFAEVLSRMSGIGHENAMKIYRDRDVDSLAMTMKAMDAPLPLFATTAAYIAGVSDAVSQVKRYAGIYKDVPADAARRALRFWKVRANASEAA
ncbi:DUF2336 domain-containing protein [Ponticaulis profundi]|uniref:DUF2336 domain-containing protein n=1 Tax=Ponticaulis profundi TaxID=2665222 RepID=A0ABW1S5K3_9PROT